ncbi:unnamed protein product [Prorocentrum cordatum]|uniref:Uncharacterized protein n=1 Tax=Prorocentrum cordatum TaxID=2364126 RepID=A0ABN9S1W6_9DINO|nr:unnamed protein product [Polarella glacialis]
MAWKGVRRGRCCSEKLAGAAAARSARLGRRSTEEAPSKREGPAIRKSKRRQARGIQGVQASVEEEEEEEEEEQQARTHPAPSPALPGRQQTLSRRRRRPGGRRLSAPPAGQRGLIRPDCMPTRSWEAAVSGTPGREGGEGEGTKKNDEEGRSKRTTVSPEGRAAQKRSRRLYLTLQRPRRRRRRPGRRVPRAPRAP